MEQTEKAVKKYDVVIVGGGINGTGIARDAALRGLKVCLCEQGDLASATSSASTKLIHGGLRYLEFGDFKLVRSALLERKLLMELLPGFITPLRFVLPFKKGMRPFWVLRLGLWIYDHLGPLGKLAPTKKRTFENNEFSTVLKDHLKQGLEYSDGWVDDARLVIFNAIEAAQEGADIRSCCKVTSAKRDETHWNVTLSTGELVKAKAIINASGPYVNQFIKEAEKSEPLRPLRLVRGSHIVVPKLYDLDQAFMLQQDDGRIIFTIPYEKYFTLIGTTEVQHHSSLKKVEISEEEISYLIEAVRKDLRKHIKHSDVCWTFSGVRPLFDSSEKGANAPKAAHKVSRDYELALDKAADLPIIHVYGGKITTFRKLAIEAVDLLSPFFANLGKSRTDTVPYSAFDQVGHEEWLKTYHENYVLLPLSLRNRWLASYGRRADWFLKKVKSKKDLGKEFGAGLFEREVRYLMTHEWAKTAEDVLWRRTKLGLHMTTSQIDTLEKWMNEQQEREDLYQL
ncbi:MAG: glycerol-3-phosphate dehydrogenase [Rhizobiales bacterium]|nr:glycerol-3-phosphate dehydrogenase [Hyphomicrobiales bacterium]